MLSTPDGERWGREDPSGQGRERRHHQSCRFDLLPPSVGKATLPKPPILFENKGLETPYAFAFAAPIAISTTVAAIWTFPQLPAGAASGNLAVLAYVSGSGVCRRTHARACARLVQSVDSGPRYSGCVIGGMRTDGSRSGGSQPDCEAGVGIRVSGWGRILHWRGGLEVIANLVPVWQRETHRLQKYKQ